MSYNNDNDNWNLKIGGNIGQEMLAQSKVAFRRPVSY